MEATARKAAMGQPGRHSQNTDRCIGARIRERRMMLHLTLLELADMTDVTYQQMHKYEAGIHRISAGRLYAIAWALGVKVDYFFQEMTTIAAAIEQPAHHRMHLELASNFLSIPNYLHQKAICRLTRTLKDQDAGLAAEADPQVS